VGSVAAATTASGGVLSHQEFDPWGAVRAGTGVSQTTLNYTGQRKDDTGLLYYHARYYDPVLSRFVSPDTVVPKTKNSTLIVDFHEEDFVSALTRENAQTLHKGFWFEGKSPSGAIDPQSLNRYSYAFNNPALLTDPSGHCPWCIGAAIGAVVGGVVGGAGYAATCDNDCNWGDAAKWVGGGIVAGAVVGSGAGLVYGALAPGAGAGVAGAAGAGGAGGVAAGQRLLNSQTWQQAEQMLSNFLVLQQHLHS
jgi:RHS repeat-associated protein